MVKEKVDTHLINEKQLTYLEKNIENIKIYKCKNKKNYLVEGISEYSEIALVKKK